MPYPHNIWQWLIGIVMPVQCVACGRYTKEQYLCRQCFNAVPIKTRSECIGCKHPTPDGRTCMFCKDTNSVDQLLIVADFNDPVVSTAIKRMKYGFIKDLLQPLHELTRKYLKARAQKGQSFLVGNPLLVPVPLHYRREHWRGFNQAQLLAEMLANAYQCETTPALVRNEHREVQANIEDREKRIENSLGLYASIQPEAVRGRNIILIDDVCTTGATLNECARVLKDAGAQSIAALVIARG